MKEDWDLRNSRQKAMDEELMEAVVGQDNATKAWKAVKRNKGAPGIDGMTTGHCHQILRPPFNTSLNSTAGCGKPHVWWCGRVPGRNPRRPTRSPALMQ